MQVAAIGGQLGRDIKFERAPRVKWYYTFAALFIEEKRRRIAHARLPLELRVIARDITTLRRPDVALVKNSKAGCTTLAQIMYFSRTGRFFDGKIHREREVLTQGIDEAARNARFVTEAQPYLFTTVRHPESRIRSAFRNIVIDQNNPSAAWHRRSLIGFGLDENKSAEHNFSVFLEYVEASIAEDRYHSDRHWREQAVNIGHGFLSHDDVIKLEELDARLPSVLDRLEIAGAGREEVLASKFNRSSPVGRVENQAHRAQIERIYARDYETFGY